MKVLGRPVGTEAVRQTTRTNASGSRSNTKTRTDAGDKVSISADARRKARQDSEETADRQSRVEAIKAQVASGEYAINAKEIAEKVIQKDPESFLTEA